MSVEAYRQAVCTRVIALLSPPTNEDLASKLAFAAANAAPPPRLPPRVVVPMRVLSWESCVALVVVGVAVGLLLDRVGPILPPPSTSHGIQAKR